MILQELQNKSIEFLKRKNIDSPRINVETILCSVLNCDRLKLYLNFDSPVLEEEQNAIREMLIRRSKGEPLQYIIGAVNFRGIELKVNSNVLIPRPETEELVQLVIDNNSKNITQILDIGTGSGCIAIAVAFQFPQSSIDAIDISHNALELAKVNATNHQLQNINFKKIDFLNEKIDKKYDIIVSNPPYIAQNDLKGLQKEVIDYEPHIALTDFADGLSFYEKLNDFAKSNLLDGGKMFLELSSENVDNICNLFTKDNITIFKDFNGLDRFLMFEL